MRGHTVPQRVWMNILLQVQSLHDELQATLHAGGTHRVRGARGGSLAATHGGKQQRGIAMRDPIVPQNLQGALG